MFERVKSFFSHTPTTYLVFGASTNTSKVGYRVFEWYGVHGLEAVPVNPRASEIGGVAAASGLDAALARVDKDRHVGFSFITPPQATLATLHELAAARDGSFRDWLAGLWFQPGSYDEAVIAYTRELGVYDRVVENEECILVSGAAGLRAATGESL